MDKVVTYTFSPVHSLETVRSLNRNRMERPAYYALQILFETFCRCGAHVTNARNVISEFVTCLFLQQHTVDVHLLLFVC